jgi:hypothetical protein
MLRMHTSQESVSTLWSKTRGILSSESYRACANKKARSEFNRQPTFVIVAFPDLNSRLCGAARHLLLPDNTCSRLLLGMPIHRKIAIKCSSLQQPSPAPLLLLPHVFTALAHSRFGVRALCSFVRARARSRFASWAFTTPC